MPKTTITRESLAKAVKQSAGLPITRAQKLVGEIFDLIKKNIKEDVPVKLRLFGNYITRQKKERIGRNPKTKVSAVISARKVVTFKVAPTLKKRINDNIENAA
jgi:integration host factor subunit alpha